MSIVTPGLTYWPNPNKGRPLFNGYVYVGIPDLDPEIPANQKQVTLKLEDGSTVQVGQPLRLSQGGVLQYNGNYAVITADGDYSVKALDSRQDQAFYIPNNSGLFDASQITLTINGADTNVSDWANALHVDDYAELEANMTSGAYGIGALVYVRETGGPSGVIELEGANIADGGTVRVAGGLAWIRPYKGGADVSWWVVKKDGSEDSSPAFISALAAVDHVLVSEGFYRNDFMVEIGDAKTLEMTAGVIIERTVDTANTDPILWIKGNFGSVLGAGQVSSRFRSKNKSPNGVVLVGHIDMATSHGNVLYNTLRDFGVQGMQAYGQTTGDVDIALHIQNPQIGGSNAVYFQTITGLRVSDANYGVYLHGGANGNTISNIQGYRTGSRLVNDGAFFYDHGSLDNAITNCFHHFSPNSTGLKMEELDNTANGGVLHQTTATSYSNFVCEQGGGSERGIDATDGSVGSCFFDVRHNTAGGNNIDDGFTTRNHLFGLNPQSGTIGKAVRTPDYQEWFAYSEADQTSRVVEFADQFTALSENTSYRLFTVSMSAASTSVLVEIEVASTWGSSITSSGVEKAIYKIERDGAGTVSAETLAHFKSDKSTARGLNFPDFLSVTGVFSYRTKNNGGALTNQSVMFKARVINALYDTNINRYATPTVYTPTAGIVADWGVTGSYTAGSGESITVKNGIITAIV